MTTAHHDLMGLSGTELLIIIGAVVVLLFGRNFPRFRGGPPAPSHPLPADDSEILKRRAKRSYDGL